MTDLTVSTTDTAKASALTSLANNLASGSSVNSLFDRILADFRITATTQKNTSPSSTATSTVKTTSTRDTSSLASRVYNLAASLSRASSALHNSLGTASTRNHTTVAAIDKGHSQHNRSNSSTQTKSDNSQTPTATADASEPQAVADTAPQPSTTDTSSSTPNNTVPQAQNTDAASSATAAPTSDTADQDPSLTDLVAQLQDFLQTLRASPSGQNASAAASSGTSTGNAPAVDPTSRTDASSAANGNDPALQDMEKMLTELLQLAKDAQKQNSDTTATAQAAATSPAPSSTIATPQVAIDPTQATAATKPASFDLNKFIKDLQTAVDPQKTQTDGQTQASVATPDKNQIMKPLSPVLAATDDSHKTAESSRDPLAFLAAAANTNATQQTTPTSMAASTTTQADISTVAAENTSDTPFESHQGNTGANSTANTGLLTNTGTPNADGTKTVSSYSFASQLTNVHSANNAALLTAVDQVRLQLGRNAKSGTDQMTLQLQPGELGRINIKLTFAEDGSVKGTVLASNATTLDMLTKDSHNLERALQDSGLRADSGSLQFGMTGQGNNNSGSYADKTNRGGKTNVDDTAVATVDATTEAAPETWLLTPGRVNLKV